MAALVPIQGLHHYAYRCRDAEETRHFYEDLLGLPLAHVIRADHVPSTGEYCPYVHIFFEMRDGSYMAFFDLGHGQAAEPSSNTRTGSTTSRCRSNPRPSSTRPAPGWRRTASRSWG